MAVNSYDHRNIDTMEMVYGKGYLSAGGDAEVVRIFEGINVENSRILDCGCGLGGAAVAMAETLNPNEVVGYDIDEVVLSRAQTLVDDKGLSDKITLLRGEPGPLPFSEGEFDVVYVTAVSCHLKELSQFFEDVFRVLKPGGWIVGSEWMIRERNPAFQNFDDLLRNRGLNFYFVAALPFENALKKAGFSTISLVDRTDAFTEFSRIGRDHVMGELKPVLQSTLGGDGYEDFLYWTEVRYAGLADGGLLQQHFRGQKST
jgi:phosphoethanolamine N-methyltransferase